MLVISEGEILGWYCDFKREDEFWFAMILSREIQGKGVGKKIIEIAKEKHKKLNGWIIVDHCYLKENNEKYKSPINFYRKMGFQIFDNIKLEPSVLNIVKIQLKL